MRILITGGSGLLGRALTQELVSGGYEVVVLSRNPDKVSGLPQGARAVGWDGRTAANWGVLADGAQGIINLAGESIKGDGFFPSRWTRARKQRIRQSRLDAASAVTEAVRLAVTKPKVLLQSSAVGYYGPRGPEPATEDQAPGSDFLAEVCQAWEASTAEVESMGVRRVVLRTGLPLTMQGGALPLLVLPFRLFAGGPFGSGQQYYPWIHVDDYIAALRFLLEDDKARGVFNISAPQPVPNRQFAHSLGRVLRRAAWLPTPAFAMRLALGEVATVVLDGQNAVPQHLQARGFKFTFQDLDSALRNLLS